MQHRNNTIVNTIMRMFFLLLISTLQAQVGVAQQLQPDPLLVKRIYFSGGSYGIDQKQAQELKQFIESFANIEQYTITVHSHTDNIGSIEFNQFLSERRSDMAVQKLLELRVPRNIITVQDFGEFNPIYDNSTFQGRLMNRRVDIILWPVETL